MARFVILEHQCHEVHWDFMLESGAALRTWRLEFAPKPDQLITATPLADHRRAYLDYEGEVSGGRGRVRRWDQGEFAWVADDPRSVELRIVGQRIRGRVYLRCGESSVWTFQLTSEEPASGARGPAQSP